MIPQASRPTPRGFFITGTDTGVGKTCFTVALLGALAGLGVRATGMKPVAAGAERQEGAWVNEDVEMISRASAVGAPAELVNPYLFREPIAPHVAAERKGVAIEIPRIAAALDELSRLADLVVVEGVGGFRVPLGPDRDTADLAVHLGLPVILVVGMRLGCLNHALLTVEAMAARKLRLAAWVANRLDPAMAAYEENLASLEARIPAPLLAEFPYMETFDSRRAARLIPPRKLDALLRGGQFSA